MAEAVLGDPLQALDEARLERLARVAGLLLGGRPLHHSGRLPHPRSIAAGLEFLEHRTLMPGDDPRHVDWRASARSRQPVVRRFRDERSGEWWIFLDRSASMTAAGAWSLALQLAAAVAYLVIALEHRCGLALFSDRLDRFQPPGRGRLAYVALRRSLAATSPRQAGGDSRLESCLPLAGPGRQVVVISDFLRPDAMRSALTSLRTRSSALHLFHVQGNTPELSEGVALELMDCETGERLDVAANTALLRRVTERQEALALNLQRYCRSHQIAYSACPVGVSWDAVLLAHLVGAEGHRA